MGITASLAAAPTLEGDFSGWALVGPTSAELSAWSSAWTGDVVPLLDPADYDSFEVRMDLELDGSGAEGDVSFEGCRPGLCDLETIGALATTRD